MKFNSIDRMDNLIFNENKFLHRDSKISRKVDFFSMKNFTQYFKSEIKEYGIDKAAGYASPLGILLDYEYVGKNE